MSALYLDEDWYLGGVEFPWRRGELIVRLLKLADRAYQDWVWATGRMQRPEQKGRNSFGMQISFAWDFLLEDLSLLDEGVQGTDHLIGTIFKSEKERDATEDVAQKLYDYTLAAIDAPLKARGGWITSATPEVCMSAPGRDALIAAAKKAFDVFMETEKDNKQFVEFIDGMKARMKRGDLI